MQRKNPPVKSKKPAIIERVATVIRSNCLIGNGERILVAVSGGSDSLALLYLLREIDMPVDLIATYIDHGLRPVEIPQEIEMLQACCRSLGVPFLTRSVDVPGLLATKKHSPEEAARILRYRALEELRRENGAEVIATGHTADDQVEQCLLRLIRGSSRRGLAGMAFAKDRIIRPLLQESKASLTDYLAGKQVAWCLDSSNLERHFLRNRVRLDLLPLLEKEFNPAIRRTILQNMKILAEEEEYLAEQTARAADSCLTIVSSPHSQNDCRIAVSAGRLLDQHPAIRKRILERCFILMGIRPAAGQIDAIADFLVRGVSGAELHLDDGVRVEKRADHLFFCRPLEPGRKRGSKVPLPVLELTVAQPGRYLLPEHDRILILEEMARPAAGLQGPRLLLDRDKVVFPLLLRSARPGETFLPCHGPGRRKVSRYFNDRKIPAHERAAWPVLLSGETIVALPGLQIDHAVRITESTTRILAIDWQSGQGES